MKQTYRNLDTFIADELKNDPEACDLYLQSALDEYQENANTKALLAALRHISEARGITKVAREAGLSRETFYKALSPSGNPKVETLAKILKVFNYKTCLMFQKMA